jgi:hypothetical protein
MGGDEEDEDKGVDDKCLGAVASVLSQVGARHIGGTISAACTTQRS